MEWIRIFGDRQAAQAALEDGKPRLLIVRGKRLCMVRRQDQFFVTEEFCPHHSESLTKGSLNYLGEIICPWHGYRFNLTTGREGAERCRDLEVFPVKEDENGIFLGL